MMSPTLDSRLRAVFASVLGVDVNALSPDSSPESIASWDSLSHISLMMAIEDDFGLQFEPAELMTLRNYGGILQRLHASEVH